MDADSADVLFRVSNLLPLKDSLGSFECMLRDGIGALETPLQSDDAMLAMLLTEKSLLSAERGRADVAGNAGSESSSSGRSKSTKADTSTDSDSFSSAASSAPPLPQDELQRQVSAALSEKFASLLRSTEKSTRNTAPDEIDLRYHTTIEIMLEENARQLNGVLSEILYMQKRLDTKQEIVTVSMNSSRNNILRLNLHLSIAGLACAIPTTVAGFFGMNVDPTVVENLHTLPFLFEAITLSSCALGALVGVKCLQLVRKGPSNVEEKLATLKTYGRLLQNLDALDKAFLHGILPRMGLAMGTNVVGKEEGERSSRAGGPQADEGDGRSSPLNVEEFTRIYKLVLGHFHGRKVSSAEARLVFDIFDQDRSGSLDTEELQSLKPATTRRK
eukprot:g12932.t1